jgi:hypothetical protein
MSKSTRHIGSLALALAGLLGSGGAFAQTWDLDACVRNGGSSCTSSGSTVSVSGYYSNSSTGNFALGTLNTGADWMGVSSKNSSNSVEDANNYPNHAIDNFTSSGASYAELVYLNFNQAVNLSSIAAAWVYDDNGGSAGGTAGHGNFQLWRWDGGSGTVGNITSYKASAMTGWTAVTTTNGDFGSSMTQTVSDGNFFSSHWLITTTFGGSGDLRRRLLGIGVVPHRIRIGVAVDKQRVVAGLPLPRAHGLGVAGQQVLLLHRVGREVVVAFDHHGVVAFGHHGAVPDGFHRHAPAWAAQAAI